MFGAIKVFLIRLLRASSCCLRFFHVITFIFIYCLLLLLDLLMLIMIMLNGRFAYQLERWWHLRRLNFKLLLLWLLWNLGAISSLLYRLLLLLFQQILRYVSVLLVDYLIILLILYTVMKIAQPQMSACRFLKLKIAVGTGLYINRMVRYPIVHGRRCLVVIDRARRSCDYVLRAWILILLLFVHHDVISCCSWFFDEELARSCCAIIVYRVHLIWVSYYCLCRSIGDLTIRFAIDRSSCTVCLLLVLILTLLCPLRIIYVELLWLG